MGTEMISADCIIPAPMMSETKRQELVESYRLGAWRRGCMIEKEWRVHNPVFDRKGEKTTTMMRIRPVRTDDEVEFVMGKFKQLESTLAPEIKEGYE